MKTDNLPAKVKKLYDHFLLLAIFSTVGPGIFLAYYLFGSTGHDDTDRFIKGILGFSVAWGICLVFVVRAIPFSRKWCWVAGVVSAIFLLLATPIGIVQGSFNLLHLLWTVWGCVILSRLLSTEAKGWFLSSKIDQPSMPEPET